MAKTVKARERQGSPSLDLTIPAEIVRDEDINAGDVFEITLDSGEEDVTLSYRRVYQS
jgi:hypothetical protein